GYSILTRSDDGTLVRKVDQVQPGDALQARVGDGRGPRLQHPHPQRRRHSGAEGRPGAAWRCAAGARRRR
ncbi:hypothetical protein C7E25_25220, partial [Stenotrophomonas maltophilia]